MLDSLVGALGADTGDHRQAATHFVDGDLDDLCAFVREERSDFARVTVHDNATPTVVSRDPREEMS